jgi:hypothetical protein
MKIARKPLIGLVALGAALAMPLAFAQSEPTTPTQDPTASQEYPTAAQDAATQAPPSDPTAAPTAEPKQMTWADVDTDKNGSISKEESSQLASLAQVFDDADGDKDGELTPDEYKAFVAQNSSTPTDDSGG